MPIADCNESGSGRGGDRAGLAADRPVVRLRGAATAVLRVPDWRDPGLSRAGRGHQGGVLPVHGEAAAVAVQYESGSLTVATQRPLCTTARNDAVEPWCWFGPKD